MPKIVYSLIIIAFLFTGCNYSSIVDSCYNDCDHLKNETDFEATIDKLVSPICPNINYIGKNIFYVTDFVNTENLNNNCNLGFLLSSKLKTHIIRDCNGKQIKAVELGKNVKVGSTGVKILSRKLDELRYKNIEKRNYILVGSYTLTKKKLILFLNLINLKTGNITASSTTSTPLTEEILELENSSNQEIYTPIVL